MLDPLVVECVRAQTIECVNEVCMALAKYLRQKKNWPVSSKAFQGLSSAKELLLWPPLYSFKESVSDLNL